MSYLLPFEDEATEGEVTEELVERTVGTAAADGAIAGDGPSTAAGAASGAVAVGGGAGLVYIYYDAEKNAGANPVDGAAGADGSLDGAVEAGEAGVEPVVVEVVADGATAAAEDGAVGGAIGEYCPSRTQVVSQERWVVYQRSIRCIKILGNASSHTQTRHLTLTSLVSARSKSARTASSITDFCSAILAAILLKIRP